MMGFTAFSSASTNTYLFFDTFIGTIPSGYPNTGIGTYMIKSVPRGSNQVSVNYYVFSLFYIEEIFCVFPLYYYDVSKTSCIECTIIPHCLNCTNNKTCTLC
jgi:hypothetical protein